MKATMMTTPQLINEIARIKELLVMNHKPFTYRQNKTYLEKLEKEYRRRINETKDNWIRAKTY